MGTVFSSGLRRYLVDGNIKPPVMGATSPNLSAISFWEWTLFAALFFLIGAVTVWSADRVPDKDGMLTITPFQTATFVENEETASLIDGLSEFSTRLLFWADTARSPIMAVGRTVKSAYLPFYYQWRGTRLSSPKLDGAHVIDKVSDGYRSLESPRIVRITIGAELSIGAINPVDLLGDGVASIPVVVDNARNTPAKLILRNAVSAAGTEGSPYQSMELKPGQALGFFLRLGPAENTNTRRLVAQVGEQTHEFVVPFRHHESGTLRVEVIDETGMPTPARVYLTGADQRAYAPPNVIQRIVMGGQEQPFPGDCYFHTSGDFAVDLPAGTAIIEVVKGLEYLPFRTTVTISPDKLNAVEIRLQRKANLARMGWYSGDVHVHANLFAEKRITPGDVLLVAKAEDLNVVNVLPCNDPRTTIITDGQYFTGGPDAVSEPGYIVYVNEEMRNDLYGHVGFLNLKSFVEPAYFGWPHSPFPYDYPGNYPQAVKAKAQGGVVTYVHPGLPSEFPVDIALGVADTIDVMSQVDEETSTGYWYRLLNCGFRCPVSAGTDSMLNIPYHLIPGAGRVYVHTGQDLTYASWIEGFKQGRSFATNGPLLQFKVNGHEAGDEIRAENGPLRIEVVGGAESIVPMEAVEIIINGLPVQRIEAGSDPLAIRVAETLEITESSWVALRVRGAGHRLATNDREVYAHTSPVYVTIGERPIASRDDALFFIQQIDALISKMDEQGVFANTAQRDEIVQKFRQGQDVYRKIARQELRR